MITAPVYMGVFSVFAGLAWLGGDKPAAAKMGIFVVALGLTWAAFAWGRPDLRHMAGFAIWAVVVVAIMQLREIGDRRDAFAAGFLMLDLLSFMAGAALVWGGASAAVTTWTGNAAMIAAALCIGGPGLLNGLDRTADYARSGISALVGAPRAAGPEPSRLDSAGADDPRDDD